MRYYILVFLLAVLAISFSGCNTLKGAAEGFGRDWQEAKKVDDWLQKNAW